MVLHADRQAARIAGQRAEPLREGIAAVQQLRARGWSFDDFRAAFDDAQTNAQLFAGAGVERADALQLLQAVHESGMPFLVALEALRRLPTVRELETRALLAEADARTAGQRAQEAGEALQRLQAEAYALWPGVRWLRLCAALERLVEGGGEAVQQLRAALAVALDKQVADDMLRHANPADEADARQQLAAWAAAQLTDLLMLRADHEDALDQARNSRNVNDVAMGMALAKVW